MTAYVTTTIPYVNGAPHIGHALEYVQADTLARHRRRRGLEVRLQTGTDDNSLKNVLAADREGLPVAQLVDRNAAAFARVLSALDVRFDRFVRTSIDPVHRAGVARLWRACAAAGDMYRRQYRGQYCVGCEQFYIPDALTADGRCPEHLTELEWVEETNWFFRLSRYAEPLRQRIEGGSLRIFPESRRNEVLALIDRGLEDFSVSRSQDRARGWGIPVPDDPSQVTYVWFDALANYLTGLGFGGDGDAPEYRAFWSGSGGERLHVLGKGVLHFHAVYWPAILLSAGLPLPTNLFVHGYFTAGRQKVSKSLGNAIDPRVLVERYGADTLRWYLLREVHPTADTDFSEARLVQRYNTDLANDLGNLLHRANTLLHRHRGGHVPPPKDELAAASGLVEIAAGLPERVDAALAAYDARHALTSVWDIVARANRVIEETSPWDLARAERAGDAGAGLRLDSVLYAALETVRVVAVHLEPFLPAAAASILAHLGCSADDTRPEPARIQWGGLIPGTVTRAPAPLFPRIEERTEADAAGR